MRDFRTRSGVATVHLVAMLGGELTACGVPIRSGLGQSAAAVKITCGRCKLTGDYRAMRKGRKPEKVKPISVEELEAFAKESP